MLLLLLSCLYNSILKERKKERKKNERTKTKCKRIIAAP